MRNAVSSPKLASESGFSLAEILVGVGLFIVLSTVIVTTVISANKSSQNSAESAMTQQELLDATSRVTREVSAAQEFIIADSDHLKVRLNEGGKEYEVSYFALGAQKKAPANVVVDESLLPEVPAIMEVRHEVGTDADDDIVRPLITGYQPDEGKANIFFYYAQGDDELTSPVEGDALKNIKRVKMNFLSFPDGSDTPLELSTSITPRTILGLDRDVFGVEDPDGQNKNITPIILTKDYDPPFRSTSAGLSWTTLEGKTNYSLNRLDLDPKATSPHSIVYSGTGTGYTDESLERGHSYLYWVVGTNINNQTVSSDNVKLIVAPPAPVATIQFSGLNQTVSWKEVTGATGYKVYRQGTASPIGTVLAGKTNQSFTSSNPSGNKSIAPYYGNTYSYYVVAYNGSGYTSENSNTVSAPTPPLPPTLNGTTKNGVRNLTYGSVPNGTNYQVRRTAPSAKTWTSATPSAISDKDEIDSDTFTYQVRAENIAGYGPWSSDTTLHPRPATPKATGSHKDGVRTIGYNAATNSVSYEVQRVSPNTTSNETSALSYSDASEIDSETFTYKVRSWNISGYSEWSNIVTLNPRPVAPVMNGSHKDGIRYANHTGVDNATKYQLERIAPTSKTWNGPAEYRGGGDSETIDADTFTYRARAGNITGFGPWSSTLTIKPRPAAPVVTGYHKNGIRTAEYEGVDNGTKYEFKRVSPEVRIWTGDASYRGGYDNQAIVNTTFKYQARAGNRTGFGPWSNTLTLNPNPGGLTVTGKDWNDKSEYRNALTWGAASNATSYEVKRGGGDYASKAASRSYTDSSPGYDSKHNYYVHGCNITGCGSYDTASALVQPPSAFDVSSVSQIKRADFYETRETYDAISEGERTHKTIIKWSSSSGADSYKFNSDPATTSRSHEWKNAGGRTYTLGIVAEGRTSGIDRKATYKYFSAPTTVKAVGFQPEVYGSSTNTLTRLAYYSTGGSYALVNDDTSAGPYKVQDKTWTLSRKGKRQSHSNNVTWHSGGAFSNWSGAKSYSGKYDKRDNKGSNTVVGGMAATRTWKAVPRGYAGGTNITDQRSISRWTPPSGIFSTGGDTSAVMFLAHPTSLSNAWAGFYPNKKWNILKNEAGNYASTNRTGLGYLVKSR